MSAAGPIAVGAARWLSAVCAAAIVFPLLASHAAANPRASRIEVHVHRDGDLRPLGGIRVEVDEAFAVTDMAGVARFLVLDDPARAVTVRDLDHHFVTREVSAAEAEAGTKTIALTPIARADLTIRATLAGLDLPVAGARVELRRAGADYAPVAIEAWTDWGGALTIREVPAGTYAARCDAPGVVPWAAEVLVRGGAETLSIALEPALREGLVTGSVTDGAGRPLAGAEVIALGASDEAAAPLATARSEPDGGFVLRGRFVGTRVHQGSAGPVPATPGPLVLRARAAGHRDGFVPLHLDARGRADARVALWAIGAPVLVREPNDTWEAAQPVPPGAPLAIDLQAPGDRDCARFPVDTDGLLTVRHASTPAPLWLRVLDRRGGLVAERGFGGGVALDWAVPLRAGVHTLDVGPWGRGAGLAEPFTLDVALTALADPRERNDEPATAAPIAPGQTDRAFLFPPGDQDVWRLPVDGPGTARLLVSPRPIAVWMRARDDRGVVLAERGAGGGAAGVLEVGVERAGSLFFEVSPWGAQPVCVEAYTTTIEWIPGDAGERALRNVPPAHAVAIPASGFFAGTLNPRGDVDTYAVVVAESGVLHARLSALPISTWMRVRDGAGRVLGERGAGVGAANELHVGLPRAGTYGVEVEQWGRGQWAADPYLLRTAFYPNDARDRRSNDLPEHASPIAPTTVVVGQIGLPRDRDTYRVFIPARAHVRAELAPHPLSRWVRVRAPGLALLSERGFGGGAAGALDAHTNEPGWHVLEVEHWGQQAWSREAYVATLDVALADRHEPPGGADDAAAATPLPLGAALSATILPVGDRDRFALFAPSAGRYRALVRAADVPRWAQLRDATGALVHERGAGGHGAIALEWDARAAGAYTLEVSGWGAVWSRDPYDVSFGPAGAPPPPRARLGARQARGDERAVTYTFGGEGEGALRFALDLGDGTRIEREAPGELTHRYDRPGWITAVVRVHDAAGRTGEAHVRVCTREPRDDRGLQVDFLAPAPGDAIDRASEVEVLAWSPDGAPVRSVRLEADGEELARWVAEPYRARLDPRAWAGRPLALRAIAASAAGGEAFAERVVHVAPLLDLAPLDGALLTSPEVWITFATADEVPSEVVVSGPDGVEHRFTGAPTRRHAVRAEGLARDRAYTWLARAGGHASAPRSFRLVKGLELTERSYAFAVERAYDQKGTIRVANHGEQAATLVLHVESEHDDLLVGFVGEGSPDKHVELAPGEQRDVLLGISAQDAMRERYAFPVTLEGRAGDEVHADHALVEVRVRMPQVELEVQLGEPDPATLAIPITLTNRGEPVTDLTVLVEPRDQALAAPALDHASLERGASKRFEVAPVLSPDFRALDAELVVRAAHVELRRPLRFALPEGKRVYFATVDVTQETQADSWYCTNRPRVQSSLTIAPGPFFGGGLGDLPRRVPLSEATTQADLAALHHRLGVWIGRRALNPKVEKVMRAILDAHIYQVDGVWVGYPRDALRELSGYLRDMAFSELSRHERWLAETRGRSRLREWLDLDLGQSLVDVTSLLSSTAGSRVTVFLETLPAEHAERIAMSFRDVKTALEAAQATGGAVQQIGDLAVRQQKLTEALARMERGLELARAATGADPAHKAEVIGRLLAIQAKAQIAARNTEQAISTLRQHVDRVKRHLGQGEAWKKYGKWLTRVAFVAGFASRYEHHSRREGMSEATAVALALAQTAAYLGATTVPIVAGADFALTGINLVGEATGLEVPTVVFAGPSGPEVGRARVSDLGLDKLLDAAVDTGFYAAGAALTDDEAAATPVSMARLRHLIERVDERAARAGDLERARLDAMRKHLERLLTAKENDP